MFVNKLVAGFFLLTSVAVAGVPQAANVQALGGTDGSSCAFVPESSNPGYFTLRAFGAVATDLYKFYQDGTAYQVTTGKTAVCTCTCYASGTAGSGNFELFTNSVTFADGIGSSTLTGSQKWEFGAAGIYSHPVVTAEQEYCEKSTWKSAATTFPGVHAGAAALFIQMQCKEI